MNTTPNDTKMIIENDPKRFEAKKYSYLAPYTFKSLGHSITDTKPKTVWSVYDNKPERFLDSGEFKLKKDCVAYMNTGTFLSDIAYQIEINRD